jgi:hypothetical protein
MKRGEKLKERQRNIRAKVEALMAAARREEEVRQRREAFRIVGGTDHEQRRGSRLGGNPSVNVPLCPQKRTFVSALSMSALCQ